MALLVAVLALAPGMADAQQSSVQQPKTLIAVLELEANNVPEPEARAIADRLRYHLARQDPFRVLERSRMETILEEVGFQVSGACNTEECVIQIGKILGVRKMVAGSVSKVGEIYALQIRLVDIQTSSIDEQAIYDVRGIEEVLQEGTADVAEVLAGLGDSPQVEQPAPPEEEPGEPQPVSGQRAVLGSGWSVGLWFSNPAKEAHQGLTLGRQRGERSFLAFSGYFFSMASAAGGGEGSSTEIALQLDPFNSRAFRVTLGIGSTSVPTGNLIGETTEQTSGLTLGFTIQTGRLLLRFGSIPSTESGGHFGFAYDFSQVRRF
jgi:TolB-like protein